MNFSFFTAEAMRTLRRNSAPSVAAFLTVMVTTLVLGVFIPITNVATGAANDVRSRLVAEVFFKDSASTAQINQVKQKLLANSDVKKVVYVSKADAKKRLNKQLQQASDLLGTNPLPRSLEVTPKNPDTIDAIVLSLKNGSGAKAAYVNPGIDSVENREDQTNKILTITGGVKLAMWILAVLLVLTSILLVGNTIRLSIYARRREIQVQRMVGATNWFVRWPFVIEGVFVGAAGGVVAVLLLVVAKHTIVDPLTSKSALFAAPSTINFYALTALLMVSAIGISALGSGFTLRRFLRV